MNFRAALLSTATACTFLLVAACGGDGQPGGASDSTRSQVASAGGDNSQSQPRAGSSSICGPDVHYVAIDLGFSGYPRTAGWGIGGGQQVGQGGSGDSESTIVEHAVLWRGSASSIVDLHPKGFSTSWAFATDGTTQVGDVRTFDHRYQAAKWSGSADSFVDLDPNGFNSRATGVAGEQIVGWSQDVDVHYHALLWIGSGVVDLTPNGFHSSVAFATDGAQQVGYGVIAPAFYQHALLWMGSPSSAVDLNPAGFLGSVAWGVNDGQQVGAGVLTTGGQSHALLWTGGAESAIDLHPSGFYRSEALAVAGGCQVGWGSPNSTIDHALVWSGTADSVVDLNAFLPPGSSAQAHGIDASGNIIGSAGAHAILWVRQ